MCCSRGARPLWRMRPLIGFSELFASRTEDGLSGSSPRRPSMLSGSASGQLRDVRRLVVAVGDGGVSRQPAGRLVVLVAHDVGVAHLARFSPLVMARCRVTSWRTDLH